MNRFQKYSRLVEPEPKFVKLSGEDLTIPTGSCECVFLVCTSPHPRSPTQMTAVSGRHRIELSSGSVLLPQTAYHPPNPRRFRTLRGSFLFSPKTTSLINPPMEDPTPGRGFRSQRPRISGFSRQNALNLTASHLCVSSR